MKPLYPTNPINDHEMAAAYIAACIAHKGKIEHLNWNQINFVIKYALSLFDQGSSGASAYESGIKTVRALADKEKRINCNQVCNQLAIKSGR